MTGAPSAHGCCTLCAKPLHDRCRHPAPEPEEHKKEHLPTWADALDAVSVF